MKKADIDPQDVEARLEKGETLRSIAASYGITHQALSLRRRAWGKSLRPNRQRTPGNTFVDQWGYTMVRTEDPHRTNPYVAEHIMVAEQVLGRSLLQGGVVHHINGNKQDNQPGNLLVCTRKQHRKLHARLEALAFELVRSGQIVFDGETYQWSQSP